MPDDNDNIDLTEGSADNLPMLQKDNRQSKVWSLRIRGVGASQIAQALGVSESTVYADLREIGRRYRDELLECDPVELIASNLQFLDEMERIALMEVNQSTGTVTKETDPLTGQVREVRTPDPNKGKFYQSALKARELKLKLLMDTGIIPKNKVELFDKLGKVVDVQEEKDNGEIRSESEIADSINRLMKHGRFMQEIKPKEVKNG